MDVETVVSKALQEIEDIDKDEFDDLKADQTRYEDVKRLMRKVAEEDKAIFVALNDKIESGNDEGIELELSKICSTKKLQRIRESLETETFDMYIAKIDGVETVKTMRNGKDVFAPIQLETVADVEYARLLQWSSILLEVAMLAGDCVGIHLHVSARRLKSVTKAVSKMMSTSPMKRSMKIFLYEWKTNTSAISRARAIFQFLRASYSASVLWKTFKLIIQDMSWFSRIRTVAILAASLVAAFATGGIALIAKIVFALNGAYKLARKIINDEHLSYIREKFDAKEADIFVQ